MLKICKINLRTFTNRHFSRLLHSETNQNEETNFGFSKVKYEEKQSKVNEVFNSVAEKYDIMNDAMSIGLHRLWKNQFIQEIDPSPGMKLIDVAGGTGDITFRYLSYLQNLDSTKFEDSKIPLVTVCDINENMLNVGKERSIKMKFQEKIVWKVGNAENLAEELDNSYDVYTIAFGIRNCTNIENVVKEAYRVLKPGGRFMCLEFSKTDNPFFKRIYDFYSFKMIPVMGYIIAGDWNSYQYLVESIRMFPSQVKLMKIKKLKDKINFKYNCWLFFKINLFLKDEFASLISDCGFRLVSYKNLTNGAVAIHSGFKF